MSDLFTMVAISAGAVLFMAGTLGLLRFPDTLSRLHALTKVDNLGLGLVIAGLMPQMGWLAATKLLALWLLVQLSGAIVTQILGRSASGEEPR
jgi:multicomponent Na+:H+ antiporter subunit G